MELPELVLVLIGVVVAAVVFVVVAMQRRREHALRDRFAEEYDRILHEHGREDRQRE
jgi:protein-S-isoprenylcysteine O-methyltransferase Ste14